MSMYGDDEYNEDKNVLYDQIKYFFEKGHSVHEFMKIVADIFKYEDVINFKKEEQS